jgi:hypothetical protein
MGCLFAMFAALLDAGHWASAARRRRTVTV